MHEHRIKDFSARFGVLVCSSTRDVKSDEAGSKIISLLKQEGHQISRYEVVKDDADAIRRNVVEFLQDSDALIISGGTGITRHDVTVEAVSGMAEYELKGFGHIFALLSFQDIGTSSILSRASAFIVLRKPVFCLPGSPKGAELGVSKIILKEIDHIHHELNR